MPPYPGDSRSSCHLTPAAALAGLAGVLFGWRPDEFWAATPEELAALLRAMAGDEPAPVDLKSLMKRFPDG